MLYQTFIHRLTQHPLDLFIPNTQQPHRYASPHFCQDKAAVCICLIRQHDNSVTVLLTLRSLQVPHSGEPAFPGGHYANGDTSLITTALRECHEETNLILPQEAVIGSLPMCQTNTQQAVLPVIATIHGPIKTQAQASEVAEIFEVPLDTLMNLQNYDVKTLRQNNHRTCHFLHYQSHIIWGFTASILYRLAQMVAS